MKQKQVAEKICPICHLKFQWRKKWRNNWGTVIYCSEKCRRNKNQY
ncbi:MAG: DUF2256 domain-containing protein [Woeseiaceae bacterium]|nr:DUF2256 domain-containing protein [Woeseiaceae bacterium]MDG1016022.1 DUF2256 domain-containing protein [Woeseiaceae bacterium]MDG1713550.1 DUF2256 domain-containing protein [Woeseiaceae bacterium]MDG1864555.1 DUF2256 domain-containing protein [Woeseiaceae bacterium]|tara:strand:- start:988 stop:1125 length:138 start_codon:yes stop_codon:yes gene_type:complete